MSKNSIKINVAPTTGWLESILVTAYEGGIGYWARGLNHKRTEDAYEWIAIYIEDEVEVDENFVPTDNGGWVNPYGPDTFVNDEWIERGNQPEVVTLLDAEVVRLGVERILSGEVGINSTLAAAILEDLKYSLENDGDGSGDIDSDAADCIIQAGLFGELVYG